MPQKPTIPRACAQCGTVTYRYPSQLRRRPNAQTFCSPSCRAAWAIGRTPKRAYTPQITKSCPVCNRPFSIPPHESNRRVYCSRPCTIAGQTAPLADRFWLLVDKNGPLPDPSIYPGLGNCWVKCGADPSKRRRWNVWCVARYRSAPIVAYTLTTGHEPPPEAPHILHHCDGGDIGCVRPSHLYAGTPTANSRDAVTRGRTARGERSGPAKLTEQQVRDIRNRRAEHGIAYSQLAREFGITRNAVRLIANGTNWKYVV